MQTVEQKWAMRNEVQRKEENEIWDGTKVVAQSQKWN